MPTKHNKLGKLGLITKPNVNYDTSIRIGVYVYTEENMKLLKSKKTINRIPLDMIYCNNCTVCLLLGEEEEINIDKYWKIYYNNNTYWVPKFNIEIVR